MTTFYGFINLKASESQGYSTYLGKSGKTEAIRWRDIIHRKVTDYPLIIVIVAFLFTFMAAQYMVY
jgi:hypothetical protein